MLSVPAADGFDGGARMGFAFAVGGDLDNAQVNAKNAAACVGGGRVGELDADAQVVVAVEKQQVGFACDASRELFALLAAVGEGERESALCGGEFRRRDAAILKHRASKTTAPLGPKAWHWERSVLYESVTLAMALTQSWAGSAKSARVLW